MNRLEVRRLKYRRWVKQKSSDPLWIQKRKETNHDSYVLHSESRKASQRGRTRRRKLEVLEHYGRVCFCCGEVIPEFLAIDHIDGGGKKHFRAIGQGNLYSWLKKNNWPAGFQVACHNCNHGRYFNGGVCPHVSGVNENNIGRTEN